MEDSNNINNIFRDKFDSDAVPKEDWNTPDDVVWNNIEKTLPKPKDDSNRSTLIPFILSLGLLDFVFLGYKYFQKVEEVENLEILLKECSDNKDDVLGNLTNQSQIVATNFQNSNENSQTNGSFVNQTVVNSTNSNVISSAQSTFVDQSNKIRNLKSGQPNDLLTPSTNSEDQSEILVLELKDKKQNLIENPDDSRPALNINPLQNSYQEPFVSNSYHFDLNVPSSNIPSINPVVKKSGPWMIGFGAGYSHWIDLKKGSINNPLSELLLNETTTPSIHYQLNVRKYVNRRLAFNIGLGTYSRNQSSTYRLSLPYSISNEVRHGEEMHNYFQHSLPTSLGNINTNLTLARSISSNVTNNENVDLDFSLSNKIHAINVPVTFIYYPSNTGQGLFFETGLNTEVIYQQTLTNITTHSFHSQVDDRDMEVAFDRKQIEQINFSIPLGMGYSKKLGKGISIDFSANYGFGLNNVHMHEGFTHKIDRLSSQVSIFKSM